MAERAYTYDHVHAALCIIEEMIDPQLKDGERPWEEYRDQWGINGLRDVVIEKLAWPCHEAWERAWERYGSTPTELQPGQTFDPGSFDYDFVPLWIRECVDWSGERPRIRGGVGINEHTLAYFREEPVS